MIVDTRWGTFIFIVRIGMDEKVQRDYLVQVPAALGRVIPDTDSTRDDFPALCEPITAIIGRSISAPTLHENEYMRWWDS